MTTSYLSFAVGLSGYLRWWVALATVLLIITDVKKKRRVDVRQYGDAHELQKSEHDRGESVAERSNKRCRPGRPAGGPLVRL